MAGKHVRDFLRISLSAKTAEWLRSTVVNLTLKDHGKCDPEREEPCKHEKNLNLEVALAFEAGLKVGKKRATLDIRCPYSTDDYKAHIKMLERMEVRIHDFANAATTHGQQARAAFKICKKIHAYAHRNAMQVIAEAAR